MDFRILGPVEALDAGRPVALAGSRQRALLGLLLLHANEVVSSERLIDELWGEEEGAEGSLRVAVSRLRRVIEPERAAGAESSILVTRAPGYELCVERGRLDLHRFEDLIEAGRSALGAGDPAGASQSLREALALWRGPPLADLTYEAFAQAEIGRLEELHAAALEDRIAAELELGEHQRLIAELQALVGRHPLRERLRAQLMLALYGAERQAEALEVYRDARRALVEELGIEPGRELRELEAAILRHDVALDRPATAAAAAAAPQPPRGPFVGRDFELAEMVGGLDEAFAGRGRLVLVAGEPGIGKSRLAEEVAALARGRGARVLVGRCWEAGGAPPYWPWVQSLRSYVAECETPALRSELGAGAADLAQLLPELRELLPGLPQQPPLDPEAARFRLFDAIASFLKRAAAERPTVLVLDDLHAADEPSLLLLQFLARVVADSRLLVVGAYRDVAPTVQEPLASALAALASERVTRLALTGLDEPDVGEFIRLAAGVKPDRATVTAIAFQTEGNALFVDEVTRLLLAEDALDERSAADLGIPQGVRDVIGLRIRRLEPGCREALAHACVLGREFAIDTLAEMMDRSPREALDLLDEALETRAVGEAPGAPGRLRFSHALARDTLYDELTVARRLALHARAGEAIEALHSGNLEPHLGELAHHFAEAAPAGTADRAVEYARRAGHGAAASLAYEEAARLYQLAIETLELTGGDDEARRCSLLLELGDAEARGGAFGAAKETFVQAAELARRLGAADELARAALGYGGRYVWFRAGNDQRLITLLEDALEAQPSERSGLRAMVLARLAGALRDRPVPGRRAALTAEAVEIARGLGDLETLAWAVEGTYASISWPRDTDGWLSMATELCEIAERLGDVEKAFSGHLHAFGAHMVRGDVDLAEAEFASLTSVAHQLRQPVQLWGLAMAGVMRALQAGRFDEAEELLERELSLGSGEKGGLTDDATFQYVSHFHEWALGRERGRLAEVRASLEAFVAEYPGYFIFRCMLASLYSEIAEDDLARAELVRLSADDFQVLEIGSEWFFGAALLAEVCERLGEAGHAPRLYEALLPYDGYVVITQPEINLGSAARYLGLLALAMGNHDDAVAHLERAVEANERMGFHPWLARSRADLARALAGVDAPRAAELSGKALRAFEALGMSEPAERLVRAVASPLGVSPRGVGPA